MTRRNLQDLPHTPSRWLRLLAALAAGVLLLARSGFSLVTRAEHSRDCVMCHIEWGDDFDKLSPLLAPPSHRVMIDGQPARNSSEEMCWSCHDAYVCDDRASFMDQDPHLTRFPKGAQAGNLPLDLDGKVYCGTCHSPHSHTMGRKYEMSPFLRGNYLSSELCLNCHSDHTGGGSNHPLHQPLAAGRGGALASSFAPRDRVECLSCHQMHSHRPTRLLEGKDATPLCASCHTAQVSVTETRHGREGGESGSCGSCHASHSKKGLPPVRGNAACLRCHNTAPGHGESRWGHPLGVAPVSAGGLPLRQGEVACVSCHDPHRWSSTGERDEGQLGTPASSFLRRPDQAEAGLCQSCHPREAAILVSDHGATEPLFVSHSKDTIWRCSACHNAHGDKVLATAADAIPGDPALSPATRLCLSCHGEDQGSAGPTWVGRFSHPLGLGIGALQPSWLPRNAGEQIGCETCHDPHQWSSTGAEWSLGQNGGDQSSFLRTDNHSGGLCLDCHQDNAAVVGSPHDRRASTGASPNVCSSCHSPHQAATAALLSTAVAGADLQHLLPESDWPADSREHSFSNWSEGAIGCLACHHDSDSGQRVPGAWFHPSWGSGELPPIVPEVHRQLKIDCRSCHNPHKPWREGGEQARVQFLTAESSETLCSTCHGDEALWRYNYYHDPERRRP